MKSKAEDYIPLAYQIAGSYTGKGIDIDDLKSAALRGLVDADKYYDPDKGTISAVVRMTVRERIVDEFKKKARKGRINLSTASSREIKDKDGGTRLEIDNVESDSYKRMQDALEHNDNMKVVLSKLKHLTKQEQYVIKRGYLIGIVENDYTGTYATHAEIAKDLGVTRQWVSAIEKKALLKLKELINE